MNILKKPLTVDSIKEMMVNKGSIEAFVQVSEGFLTLYVDDQNDILSELICGNEGYFVDIHYDVLENSRGTLLLKVSGKVNIDDIA